MLEFVLAISPIVPAIISLVKYKQMDKKFYPFVYTIWLAVIVELLAQVAIETKNNSLYCTVYNSFTLINFPLLLSFFVNYKTLTKKTAVTFFIISIVLKLLNFYLYKDIKVLRESYLIDCFVGLLLSIKTLNNIIFFSNEKLIKSTIFIVLISMVVLTSFELLNNILVWIFYISKTVMQKITIIFFVVNALCYFLISYAFLCIPTNKK